MSPDELMAYEAARPDGDNPNEWEAEDEFARAVADAHFEAVLEDCYRNLQKEQNQ